MDEYGEKWCGNCKHYIEFFTGNKMIEICCKHRIRICAEENLLCYGWENDDLHDNDAVERTQQKDNQTVSRKE